MSLLRRPTAVICLAVLLVIALAAAMADWLAPYRPNQVDLAAVLAAPGGRHLLGGDGSGRDVLSRLLHGAGPSLLGALLATGVGIVVGVPTGLVAGYVGRWGEAVLSWLFNLTLTLPAIIVILAFVAVAGPGMTGTMVLVGVLLSPTFYRLVRGRARQVRDELYVDAARVAGLSQPRIVGRHILPVVGSAIVVQTPLLFGATLLIQAGIDFIGLGTPGEASWGSMLNDASSNVLTDPWLSVWPGAAIAITVLAVTLLGNLAADTLEGTPTPPRETAETAAPATPGEPVEGALLSVEGLTVAYGDLAVVEGVSLGVRRGEVLGLVGESGSGKTQTVLAALGLLPRGARVTGGIVRFDGREGTGGTLGARIGYVSQEPMANLDPSFRVGSQIVEPIRTHLGLSRADARRRALDLLARVGIAEPERIFRSYPHEISGGTAQRVLIAAAVCCDPDLLVADEPTTALDVTVQAEVLDLLRSLRDERGMAVLLVTHDLGVVADLCDRVAVMRSGRLVETAPVKSLFADPADPYTARLVATDSYYPRSRTTAEPHVPLLSVEELRVSFRQRGLRRPPLEVLHGVSLSVGAGETLGLVGESGSGKTTLGRTVLGLLQPSGGRVTFHGGSRRAIQAVFQDPYGSLNPAMSIRDILVEPLLATGRAQADAKVAALLDRVGLPATTGRRRARELSGGQRQRVAIARALALDPRLVVCDEPVSALDATTQAQVIDLLVEIQRETGVAYLFISHDLGVVRHVSDRVAVMSRGEIVESGDTERVTGEPQDAYTRRLLLSALVPDPEEQARRRAARLQMFPPRAERLL